MLLTVSVGSVDSEEIVNHHNNNIIIMKTTLTMTLVMNSCGYVCALFSNDELL